MNIDILNELNEQQKSIVFCNESCIVNAGAGTGKTQTLISKIIKLVSIDKIKPDNILIVTFTIAATLELSHRLNKYLPKYKFKHIYTFHGFARYIISAVQHLKNISMYRFETNIENGTDPEIREHIIKAFNRNMYLSSFVETIKPKTLNTNSMDQKKWEDISYCVSILSSIISLLRNSEYLWKKDFNVIKSNILYNFACLRIPLYLRNKLRSSIVNAIREYYSEYRHILNKLQLLDYDDLIINAHDLLQEHPDVLNNIQNQFKHIIVDEFQDTSYPQYELLKKIKLVNTKLDIIGDDYQSVYSFNGSNLRNIFNAVNDFNINKIFDLTINYRSYPKILNIANILMLKEPNKFSEKTLRSYRDLNDENCVVFKHFDTDINMEKYLLNEIKMLNNNGVNLKNIVMLCRTNVYVRHYKKLFSLIGIKCNSVHNKDKAIRSFESYFYFIHQSHINTKEVLSQIFSSDYENAIKFNFGKKSLDKLLGYIDKNNLNIKETLLNQNLISIIPKKSQEHFIEILKFLKYIENNKNNIKLDEIKVFNRHIFNNNISIERYLNTIEEEQHDVSFLSIQEILRIFKSKDESINQERLNITTIHQSKGLEFDYVFIPNLNEGKLPITCSHSELCFDGFKYCKFISEERRLLYVAITRAKLRIYLLTSTKNRNPRNLEFIRNEKISSFIENISFDRL